MGKNIWIINQYAITPDLPGGTRHYDLGSELVKRGFGVTIFASGFHYGVRQDLKLGKNEKHRIENYNGVNFVWIKTFAYKKSNWRRMANMVFFAWDSYWLGRSLPKIKTIGKPDVIIGSSVHLFAVAAAYGLSLYYKVPFIMEVRDLWPKTLIDIGKYKKTDPVVRVLAMLEKFLYAKADKIIVLLPSARDYIVPLGISGDKIVWISNGVDLSNFPLEAPSADNDSTFKVIYLGAHGIANALDIVLDAARVIQERGNDPIKFIFVGDGDGKDKLRTYAKKLDLKNVEFRDPVKKNMVRSVLNEADVLVIPIRMKEIYKYGISQNKLFDYMASAKPVILSGDPVNNPVRDSGGGIFVPSEDPAKLADAVMTLYNMTLGERVAMGMKGRDYVEKNNSIPVLADKLQKVIEEVAGKTKKWTK